MRQKKNYATPEFYAILCEKNDIMTASGDIVGSFGNEANDNTALTPGQGWFGR